MIAPLLAALFDRIRTHPALRTALGEALHGSGQATLGGLTFEAALLVSAAVAVEVHRPAVVLFATEKQAEAAREPLRWFYRILSGRAEAEVGFLPSLDWRNPNASLHPALGAARAVALWQFASGIAQVLVTSAAAAAMHLQPAAFYRSLGSTLRSGQPLEREELIEHLVRTGYERQDLVEAVGQFAVRGGIIDVFPPNVLRPIRVELLGDTVESLREFDPTTQRSVAPVQYVSLAPMSEIASPGPAWLDAHSERSSLPEPIAGSGAGPAPRGSLFELAPAAIVILHEPDAVQQKLDALWQTLTPTPAERSNRDGAGSPRWSWMDPTEWQQQLTSRVRVMLRQLILDSEPIPNLRSQPTVSYHGNLAAWTAEVRNELAAGHQVVLGAATRGDLARLVDFCREHELPFQLGAWPEGMDLTEWGAEIAPPTGGTIVLTETPLATGFVLPDLHLVFYGSGDLFDWPARPRRRPQTAFSTDVSEWKPGDRVVHVDYGIGEYEGIEQLVADGTPTEFLKLRYADNARVYVPLARLDLVQKYRSIGQARPPLDRLGSGNWVSRKKRARRAIDDLARRLLRLQAERQALAGTAFPPDTPWEKELEESFEYEETPDQLRVIEEVKRDLQAPRPMDRLVCGDVGYGKTEVAVRAAFKVVLAGKQVAVLAPTTVLVFQHYETFRRRLAMFPVRVEMLSRLQSRRQQKQVLDELAAGRVDIVIGTHRLLSSDVVFHDLGLIVVDEEQRFGVSHKERLKELRQNIDVLTLTATPIPRTLHMSLLGLRDLSVMETPPRGRLAIQTVVAPFSEALIREAIEQELAREGQVFFVHNRVESIGEIVALIHRLVPRARVVVGHGQMSERQLEEVMLRFMRHEADVLVATTIIENGLDIPRANTLIVNRADRFGLAELYQLRGRVGRSDQRAYAYLLVPPDTALTTEAQQRLAALKEFSELGAGFRIAALDLELRGAGNLLGREQHGHINAIGFDLYCQMLQQAVAELNGQAPRPEHPVTLQLGLDIRIPADYIPAESTRLQCYRRIATLRTEEDAHELRQELEDRFGPPPLPVLQLIEYAQLKALCESLGVLAVERRDHRLTFQFARQTPIRPERLVRFVRSWRGAQLDPSGRLSLPWTPAQGNPAAAARHVLLKLQASD